MLQRLLLWGAIHKHNLSHIQTLYLPAMCETFSIEKEWKKGLHIVGRYSDAKEYR